MELPRTNQTFFELHVPRLLTLPVLPRLGRWRLAVIAAMGYRLQLPSSAGGFMRRSVFYSLAHFVAHLVASLLSSVDG